MAAASNSKREPISALGVCFISRCHLRRCIAQDELPFHWGLAVIVTAGGDYARDHWKSLVKITDLSMRSTKKLMQ